MLQIENILILAKTYPSPSSKYSETSCVAGITDKGESRRLYPIPFRLLDDGQKFKKWQWVEVATQLNTMDKRKESRKIAYDTLKLHTVVETKDNWNDRKYWISNMPEVKIFSDDKPTKPADINEDVTLALFKPKEFSLEISKCSPEWTKEEKRNLIKMGEQETSLFTSEEKMLPKTTLQKVPYDFYYIIPVQTQAGSTRKMKIKIIDWEAYSLYFTCTQSYGLNWEAKFREKLEDCFRNKEITLLLGNLHRFQWEWVIVSLIYPPMKGAGGGQSSLFN